MSSEKKGCCLFTLIKWALIGFVAITLLTLFTSTSDTAPTATTEPAVSSTSSPTAAPTDAPAPTAEPQTLQEWAEHIAQSVYGRFDSPFTNLLSVSCEQVDGDPAPMITINVNYPDSFMRDNDARMSGFLFDAMNTTWKLADLAKEGKIEYGSVFIHGKTTFLDKYGAESVGDAAQIRIKASEAAKVNWSYSTFTGDMLPGIAVSFGINPVIRDGLTAEYLNKIR